MLDENLPVFHFTRSQGQPEHLAAFYLSRGGADPQPAYTIHHPEPSQPNSKNKYAVALFDAFNPDVLYGEVLVLPKWYLPSLSQDDLRRSGGVPPPPEPVTPTEFTIQLYNPDQQIKVAHHTGGLVGNPYWEFSVPQDSFRLPSGSQLDRSQNDPGADYTTPKINFRWKRESKLSKEMTCYITGKSTDMTGRKHRKDPDITVALFKNLKEITLYEPNFNRIEMEDPKGLEIALLLGATTIRDVYFGNPNKIFNISEGGRRRSSAGASSPPLLGADGAVSGAGRAHGSGLTAGASALYSQPRRPSMDRPSLPTRPDPSPPITDARTQWEIDAETARLKYAHDAELHQLRKQEEAAKRQKQREVDEETKRLRKMVEQEARDARRRRDEIDRETERLRRQHGNQLLNQSRPAATAPLGQTPFQPPARPHSAQPGSVQGYHAPLQPPQNGGSSYMSGALPSGTTKPKKSIFNLRAEEGSKLSKKRSSAW